MTEKVFRWVKCSERMPPDVDDCRRFIVISDVGIVCEMHSSRVKNGKAQLWLEELPPQPEPSEDLVERVAEAIMSELTSGYSFGDLKYDASVDPFQQENVDRYINAAKAAIAATPARTEGVDLEAAKEAALTGLFCDKFGNTKFDPEKAVRKLAESCGLKIKEQKSC
jgi:hypothetical protein